ncbi:unnamed protein product [Rhizoctonia solani]|uniref:Uncharacterized protein n=1 Tax=Rhizoctonia solani TaxID=456999 RepID=A0A8H3DYB0_9AGAM|nr:unnamed protein product [Rhizoctonia solani]
MSEPSLAYRAVDASLGALSHLATSIDNSLRPVSANRNVYNRDPDHEVNAATATIETFRRQLRLGAPITPSLEAVYGLVDAIKNSKSLDDRKMLIFMAHKSLTDEDLRRFKFYAPFVKHLNSFKIEKYFRYRLRGWKQLLMALGNHPLLPNLSTLIFNTRPTTTMFEQQAWFMLLLSPSIRELNLATTSSHRTYNASAAELFFRSMSTTLLGITDPSSSSMASQPSPSRQNITIRTEGADVEDISWFTTVRDLANISNLVVSMSTLGAGKLSTIGLLPQLKSLELDFDIILDGESTSSYIAQHLPNDAFLRLTHFGLRNLPDPSSFHTIWNLTPLVSHLTSFALHFNKYRWMNVLTNDQIMSDFISPISEKSPNLVDLAIHPPEYEWDEAESSAPMFSLISRLPLTRLRFAPMIPLHISIPHTAGKYHLLKRLELTTSWVGVSDIKNLATTFPNLDYLAMQITIHSEDFQSTLVTPTASQPIVLYIMSVFLEEDPFWDRSMVGDKLSRSVSIVIATSSRLIIREIRLLCSLWSKARYMTKESDVLRSKFTPCWATTRLLI